MRTRASRRAVVVILALGVPTAAGRAAPGGPPRGGGAPSLRLPFPAGESWLVTRAYNTASHTGRDAYALDFALGGCASWRRTIVAAAGGTVTFASGTAGNNCGGSGYGLYVDIDHGGGYVTRYAHLDEILVQDGNVVSQGTPIGLCGNSGNACGSACPAHPGTHLHFRLTLNNNATIPEPMSGYTGFAEGRRYTSDNSTQDPCSPGEGQDCNGNGRRDDCEAAPRLYVNAAAGGANSGQSWANAFRDLRSALCVAAAAPQVVNEIWVARGTYRPAGPGGDRSATFRLSSSVAVYGGFTGRETGLGQRSPQTNVTILSGDLNGDDAAPGGYAENAYHVATATNTDLTAVLDGFTIRGGNASGSGWTTSAGAGIFIEENGSPAIRNCIIEGNRSTDDAGGLYAGDASRPAIRGCVLRQNTAADDAGALMTFAPVTMTDCTFSGNHAGDDAGAIMSFGSLTLTDCRLTGNEAGDDAGALMTFAPAQLHNCTINGNGVGDDAGAIMTFDRATIADCTLNANYCGDDGGVIMSFYSLLLARSSFDGNTAGGNGGAIMCFVTYASDEVSFTGCTFTNNTAVNDSGVVENYANGNATGLVVRGCTFRGNRASADEDFGATGGGVMVNYGPLTLERCILDDNHTDADGGVLVNFDRLVLTTCLLTRNTAAGRGGAFLLWDDSTPRVNFCTFAANAAGVSGGAIHCDGSRPRVSNSILWADDAPLGPEIYIESGAVQLAHCIVGGGSTGVFVEDGTLDWGPRTLDADPLFLGPDERRLASGSAAIDAGDGWARGGEAATDLDGMPRGQGCAVDLGAYESASGTGPDCDGNGISDGCDISGGSSDDCNRNGVPDECETGLPDCNSNGIMDECETDTDSDGVIDDCEQCPTNPNLTLPGPCGCSDVQADCNTNDVCDGQEVFGGTAQDCDGDFVPDECEPDSDSDGAIDDCDGCPLDPTNADSDSDGALDCIDGCPADPAKTAPGPCGCDRLDVDCNANGVCDADETQFPDCNSNGAPDECEMDSDTDGTIDNCDGCPLNPALTGPDAMCGCVFTDCNTNGVCDAAEVIVGSSADCDSDGGPDECEADSDGDGTMDDCDECPNDANKTTPGLCGCGAPDADCNGNAVCDATDTSGGTSADCNADGMPDDCEIGFPDCNRNSVSDDCETDLVPSVTQAPVDQAVCEGASLVLSVEATGSSLTYQWRLNGVAVAGATGRELRIESAGPTDVGAYEVEVKNECGQVVAGPAAIQVWVTGTGDANLDRQLNGLDIAAFAAVVLYASNGHADVVFCAADLTADQSVDHADVSAFVTLLLGL